MRSVIVWIAAICVEGILYALGNYLERTHASLGAGIAVGLTQLPGSFIGDLVLPRSSPLWLFDLVMCGVQVVAFSIFFHLVLLLRAKLRNPVP
jgi:hypothetical protein